MIAVSQEKQPACASDYWFKHWNKHSQQRPRSHLGHCAEPACKHYQLLVFFPLEALQCYCNKTLEIVVGTFWHVCEWRMQVELIFLPMYARRHYMPWSSWWGILRCCHLRAPPYSRWVYHYQRRLSSFLLGRSSVKLVISSCWNREITSVSNRSSVLQAAASNMLA